MTGSVCDDDNKFIDECLARFDAAFDVPECAMVEILGKVELAKKGLFDVKGWDVFTAIKMRDNNINAVWMMRLYAGISEQDDNNVLNKRRSNGGRKIIIKLM